ncbi:hypothetical protein GFY24_29445 [Nocardia sp. SYP-A9097]|uniref:hypothetical protein n=1 Tax=Nocardia sp. SYP-A9097 TaxID=2663237 RepID=UPI00129A8F45|nr:hypothetical protein [Nocardia sp. SYP-A9097]MRH91517.1 hypothetical protein [Nocardia sp. SYP-A9097]
MPENSFILSVAEIDRDIAEREREIDAIAATLYELDKHPGLILLRRFPPTGVTETRWAPARAAMDLLWEDFGRLRTILEQAHAVRMRRRLEALDREELTVILRGQPMEVARTAIPLAQRSLMGPGEVIVRVGFTELVARMHEGFPCIVEVLDAVDAVNGRVMSEIAPLRTELDRIGTGLPELRALSDDLDELSARAAGDPLALPVAEIDRRIAELGRRMREAATLRAELAAMIADWDGAISRIRTQVETLRKIYERTHLARIAVERTILTSQLPEHADDSAVFGSELTTLDATPPDPSALWDLRRRVTAALAAAGEAEQLVQGLLDRRAELRGRLSAYRAKAARLGVSEDREVLASSRIAAGLLTRKPCDLAAVTRAITDYRQLIAQKTGRRP